jgi:hypothetical protein
MSDDNGSNWREDTGWFPFVNETTNGTLYTASTPIKVILPFPTLIRFRIVLFYPILPFPTPKPKQIPILPFLLKSPRKLDSSNG